MFASQEANIKSVLSLFAITPFTWPFFAASSNSMGIWFSAVEATAWRAALSAQLTTPSPTLK